MNLTISSANDFKVVTVDGRIDTTNAMEFEAKMMEQINQGSTRMILDCSGLNYISSSGLRAFLVLNKKMASGAGQFRLCNLQPGIREIFDISGFTTIFSVYPDLDSAAKG